MNRGLLAFSILLIIVGVVWQEYAISLFGFILLFPALLSSSRARIPHAPEPRAQEPRRLTPRPFQAYQPEASAPPAQPRPSPPAPLPAHPTPIYSPALFPTAIFPSQSTSLSQPRESSQAEPQHPEKDEVLEVGALLALFRLAFG